MQFISYELISELLFKSILLPQEDPKKIGELITDINVTTQNFIRRAGAYDGKENRKVVKKYYQKLYNDWNTEMGKLAEKVENI